VPIIRTVLFFTIPEINERYLSLFEVHVFFSFYSGFFQLLVERGQIDTPKVIKAIPRRQQKYNATRR
jgi:hypothetical protein